MRVAVIALTVLALAAVPSASADEASDEQALAERYAPVVQLRTQAEPCDRQGDAYFPVAVETFLGRDDVTLVGPDREAIKAPTAADIAGQRRRLVPRLPRQPAPPGLRLRALVQDDRGRASGHDLRPRRARGRPDRAAVLAVLRLQRLEQHPRGRLGDAPDHVRRADRDGGAADVADRGRVLAAHRRRAQRLDRRLPPARRRAAGRVPGRRLARAVLLATGCGWASAPRPASAATTRALPSTRVEPDVVLLPDTPPATGKFAWLTFAGLWGERVRGPYSGPTGPGREAAVAGAGRLDRRLAQRQPRGARGALARADLDRRLLRRHRRRLGRAAAAAVRPGDGPHRAGRADPARRLPDPPHAVAAAHARPDRPHPAGRRDAARRLAHLPAQQAPAARRSAPSRCRSASLGTLWVELLLRSTGLGSLLDTGEGGPAVFGGISFLLLSGGIATFVPLVLVTMAVAAAVGDLAAGETPRHRRAADARARAGGGRRPSGSCSPSRSCCS